MEPQTGTPTALLPLVLLGAITLLGAVLRVHHAGIRPFWLDENHTYHVVNEVDGFFAMLRFWWSTFHVSDPPLYYILNYPFTGGDPLASLFAMRVPGILFGVAAIPAMYAVARLISTRPVALAAAFCMAVNTFAVQYSQEYRPYSLLLLVTLLYLHAQILVMVRGHSRARWIWLLAASVALLYTHFFGGFVMVGGYAVWWAYEVAHNRTRVPWKQLLLLPVILFVAYIPVLAYGISQAGHFSLSAGDATNAAKQMEAAFLAQKEYLSYWTNLPYSLATWYLAKPAPFAAIFALGLAAAALPLLAWRRPGQLALLVLFTLITTVIVFVFYEVMRYPFEPRRSIIQLPVLVFLQGVVLAAPYHLLERMRDGSRTGAVLSGMLGLVMLGVGLDNFVRFDNGGNRYPSSNADWPGMVDIVARHAAPGDVMATHMAPGDTWMSSNIGFNHARSQTSVPLRTISTVPELDAVLAETGAGVWYSFGLHRPIDPVLAKHILLHGQWHCLVGGAVVYLPPTLPRAVATDGTTETLYVRAAGSYALSLERPGFPFVANLRLPDQPETVVTLNNSSPYRLMDLEPGLLSFEARFTTATANSTTWTLYRRIEPGEWQRAVDFSRWEANPSAIMAPYIGGELALQMRYNGKADYRFFLDEGGEFDLTIEAKHDAPGPIDLRVFASNAGELPRFTFANADNRFGQVTQRVTLRPGLNAITVYYPSFRRIQDPVRDPEDAYNEFVFTRWKLSKI